MIDLQEVNLTEEFITAQKQAFHRAFMPLDSPLMRDLILFCRGRSTVAAADPYRTYLLEGRRQWLLRVYEHLERSPDRIIEDYQNLENYYG